MDDSGGGLDGMEAEPIWVVPASGFELRWPPSVFAVEARAVGRLRKPALGDWSGAVELLLQEALTGAAAVEEFRELGEADRGRGFGDPWGARPSGRPRADGTTDELPVETPQVFLSRLAGRAGEMRRADMPRPLWSERHGQPRPVAEPVSLPRLVEWFVLLVRDLDARGYFDQALPAGCRDAGDEDLVDPSLVLLERIGVPDLWPVEASRDRWNPATDPGLFYDLIETLHDLVARPRSRWFHPYFDHWHFGDFASSTGQSLYRWRVNKLLQRAGVELELAASGEDVGRLVRTVGDDRDQLAARVAAVGSKRGTREHAVALFRGRGASAQKKHSAILALLGLLEARRNLVKTELLSKDEGALFSIANQFALRHQGADQRADYDEAYLDWLYWWYLATLDLTDRLLARQADGGPASTP